MDARTWGFVVAFISAVVVMMLLPTIFAWCVARKTGIDAASRRSFVTVCTLLAYGAMGVAGAVCGPIDMLAEYVAPQLYEDGHTSISRILMSASHATLFVALGSGLATSAWVPLRLRRVWPGVLAAYRAPSSFPSP